MARTRALLALLAALTAIVMACGPQASPAVLPGNTGVPSAGPTNAPPLTQPGNSPIGY